MAAPARKVRLEFKSKTPQAQAWAAQHAARYVTRVSEQTRQALRALVVSSLRDGITVDDLADMVQESIGLNVVQAGAVEGFWSRLVKQGILNRSTIGKEVYKYSQRLMRERAFTIARTEVMGALNAGALAAAEQAVEKGLLNPETAVKMWLVSKDEINPPCPVCMPLDHEEVPLYGLFETRKGKQVIHLAAPPAHPRCRCSFAVLPESRKKKR